MLSSLIVMVLLIGTAMIPAFAGSLTLSSADKLEASADSDSVTSNEAEIAEAKAETGSQIINEPEKVEPEPTVVESELVAADEECSSCGNSGQSTITSEPSGEVSIEQLKVDPNSSDPPCYNCIEVAFLAVDYAKEELKDSFPRIKDYIGYGLTWYIYYVDGLWSWFGSFKDTLIDGFDKYGFQPGFNIMTAISDATEYTIEIFYKLLEDPNLVHKILATFLLPVFIVKLTLNLVELCFGDGNGSQTQTMVQSAMETMEQSTMEITEAGSTQQAQNI